MKDLHAIRHYYRPIQPTVKGEVGNMVYHEVLPAKEIQPYVYCYWQLKTNQQLPTPFTYRVVSDGCIDIFFNHHAMQENFVMGFCRRYTEFSIGDTFDYIGIRFLPSVFPMLFQVDGKSLSNQSQDLKDVLPEISQWIEEDLGSDQTFEQICEAFNKRLSQNIKDGQFDYDPRFFKSLRLIFEKKGYLDTELDLDTGLSPRQLRRIFNYYIGTTTKTFSNVVRFQHILNAKPSSESLKDNKLYYDVGFFDQAHFIKNFKTFYGVTPARAFR